MSYVNERRIAEAATKGPWWTNRDIRPPLVYAGDGSLDDVIVAQMFDQVDAEFIAAFGPPRVLELLNENERLELKSSG